MSILDSDDLVCYACDAPVDSVRAAVRIIESRVVRVCSSCSSGVVVTTLTPQQHDARIVESVVQESPPELELLVEQETVDEPSGARRFSRRGGVGVAAALLVSVPVLAMAFANEGSVQRLAAPDFGSERPATRLLSLQSSPIELFEPTAPTLVDATSWVHPVVGSEEVVPAKGTRLFGAERPGDRPPECRRGHCGVDLDAPRGAPVVAVRPGVIEKVMDDEDAAGGRYVWIRHDDLNLRTEYFHFDRVAPDLVAGESVMAGQWLGTLGRSGIEHSEPHLHFAVRDLTRGSRYIDPVPFLEPARVVGLLDLRLADVP